MTEFQPGDQVRFRLGERMPETMECCGETVDSWQWMVDTDHIAGVFTVSQTTRMCSHCKQFCTKKLKVTLKCDIYELHGVNYSAFGAYPEELELVE